MSPHKNNHYSNHHSKFSHDHFFKESMQSVTIAGEVAKVFLNPLLVSQIDWTSFKIVKDGWITKELQEYRSDILYRVKLVKMQIWVYLLFEHKSYPDKKYSKQLLGYMLEIWDQLEQQEPSVDIYPVVIPVLVYHGDKSWKIENSIKPLFAIKKETEKFVPDFRSVIIDLSEFDCEKIQGYALKMFLLALKYSRKTEVLKIVPEIIRISENLENGDDYLKVVLIYLGSVIKSNDLNEYWQIISKEHKKGRVFMETIADILRKEERLKHEKIENELRKEIHQKNTIIEQKNTVIANKDIEIEQIIERMSKMNMSTQFINKFTGISIEKIEQVIKRTDRQ